MRILITFLLCLVLAGSAVAAEKTVETAPLKGEAQATLVGPAGVCVFGNQNPAFYAYGDWIWGAETYATVFDAVQPGCGCIEGFNVEAVHMYMNFGLEDVPVSFDLTASFLETVFDVDAGCELPGPEICTSPLYTVSITTAGLYDISIPLNTETCACAYFGYKYAVSMNIVTAFASSPDAVSDEFPVGCTSSNDYGSGWLDLQSFGWSGEVNIYADILCCGPAVPNEDRSWGDVKSLFR